MAKESNKEATEFTQSIGNYKVPDVSVVRQDGQKLSFIKELDDGRPIVMNFIFASCSAICPMLSHVFSKVQDKLGKSGQKYHLVSISIDPENDTPAKLTEYAHKFEAGSSWDFYTGTIETSIAIQKAFNVYRGDKMNHSSVILMRAEPGKSWLRLDGFMSPDEVIHEYVELKQK
jgi:protein SCO1/2